MEIWEAAHRHGVDAGDITYVLRHAIAVFPITGSDGDEAAMYIGLSADGARVLEVLVVDEGTDRARVVHADRARKHYLRRLP